MEGIAGSKSRADNALTADKAHLYRQFGRECLDESVFL